MPAPEYPDWLIEEAHEAVRLAQGQPLAAALWMIERLKERGCKVVSLNATDEMRASLDHVRVEFDAEGMAHIGRLYRHSAAKVYGAMIDAAPPFPTQRPER